MHRQTLICVTILFMSMCLQCSNDAGGRERGREGRREEGRQAAGSSHYVVLAWCFLECIHVAGRRILFKFPL